MTPSVEAVVTELASAQGNTWVGVDAVCQGKDKVLRRQIADAVHNGSLVKRKLFEEEVITTRKVRDMEREIAHLIIKETHGTSEIPDLDDEVIDFLIERYEKSEAARTGSPYALAKEQRESVHSLVHNHFSVLIGGPGTGKTTCLKCGAQVMKWAYPTADIRFAAPTGKAARRCTESSGYPASTIQKMMGLKADGGKPTKKISADVLIVDEVSMLDTETMLAFLHSVSPRTKVMLVGDTDQLPSVGPGAVLRDLLGSMVVPFCKLEQTFRQATDSNIFCNITYLRKGFGELEEGDDFILSPATDDTAFDMIIESYIRAVGKWGADNVVCLTPFRRKGRTCANRINAEMQRRLNPGKVSLKTTIKDEGYERQVDYRYGDPVMQLVNRAEVANGDVGKVCKVGEDFIVVRFTDCTVRYSSAELAQLDLAYAMSIHKSQGSEYKCVITACLPEHQGMIDRNMLYTAVTRAKKVCHLVYDWDVLQDTVKVETSGRRVTMLADYLIEEKAAYDLCPELYLRL